MKKSIIAIGLTLMTSTAFANGPCYNANFNGLPSVNQKTANLQKKFQRAQLPTEAQLAQIWGTYGCVDSSAMRDELSILGDDFSKSCAPEMTSKLMFDMRLGYLILDEAFSGTPVITSTGVLSVSDDQSYVVRYLPSENGPAEFIIERGTTNEGLPEQADYYAQSTDSNNLPVLISYVECAITQ